MDANGDGALTEAEIGAMQAQMQGRGGMGSAGQATGEMARAGAVMATACTGRATANGRGWGWRQLTDGWRVPGPAAGRRGDRCLYVMQDDDAAATADAEVPDEALLVLYANGDRRPRAC